MKRGEEGQHWAGFSHQVAKALSVTLIPTLTVYVLTPSKAQGQAGLPASALLLREWELPAPRPPRKELGPLPGQQFASRQAGNRVRSVDCLGNIPGDVATWPKVHSLAAKEKTRSNSLGQSKMCHFCRIDECYGGWVGDGRATCDRKTAGMAVWGILCPFPCGKLPSCKTIPQGPVRKYRPQSEPVSRSLDTKTRRIRKFGTCPFLVDKFCKLTKKRSGNPWKKLSRRMSSSQGRITATADYSGAVSEQGVIYSDGALKVCSPQQQAGSAIPASNCLQLKQRSMKEIL